MIFGYTRTSTRDKQDDDLQRRALIGAGVKERLIFSDQASGAKVARSRPGWATLDARLRDDDELVVWRIDRIGRSMIDVIMTLQGLVARGVAVRSLSDRLGPRRVKTDSCSTSWRHLPSMSVSSSRSASRPESTLPGHAAYGSGVRRSTPMTPRRRCAQSSTSSARKD